MTVRTIREVRIHRRLNVEFSSLFDFAPKCATADAQPEAVSGAVKGSLRSSLESRAADLCREARSRQNGL